MMFASGEVSHDTLLTLMMSMFAIAISSPIMVMLIQSRQVKQQRVEDSMSREEIAARLEASNREVAQKAKEAADRTDRSLSIIHHLVNSNLTKVMEGERQAVEQALGAITEAIDQKLSMGQEVLPESFAAQAALDQQLEALNEAIHERHRALRLINGSNNGSDNSPT